MTAWRPVLHLPRPEVARAVAALRTLLDRESPPPPAEDLLSARDLLDALDDRAHDVDEDLLDDLGAPAAGGGRITVEHTTRAWMDDVARAARLRGPAPSAAPPEDAPARVRVILDYAPRGGSDE